MLKFNRILRTLLASLLLLLPVSAFAASSLTISSPNNDGNFVVQGSLAGVNGIQIDIGYDSTTLSNPSVTTGALLGGLLSATNSGSNPIHFAGAMPSGSINSQGVALTISFTPVAGTAGTITSFSVKALDGKSQNVAVATYVRNPSAVASNTDTTGGSGGSGSTSGGSGTTGGGSGTAGTTDTANTGTKGTSSQPFVAGGTLTFPADSNPADNPAARPAPQADQEGQGRGGNQGTAAQTASTPPSDQQENAAKPAPQQVYHARQLVSVLERFRLFTGEKTPENLMALFRPENSATFIQTPAVAIADGKSTVILTITGVPGDRAPNFSFTSAHYVALDRTGDGEWEIEVRPDQGAVTASVTMLHGGVVQEFPLTVAPKVELAAAKQGAAPSEADFALFLKERGTPTAPKYDLNGDGKRDYIDDYIYTANYLDRLQKKTGQSAK
ncbi:cohesin domain-containing protein [Geomonas sp. Red32]|uniref:cohesin domain-containing protein n=1 Tax=Geomonas sp. Red32 TaxID=2912856 RepID=UPI00202CCFB3|nr:cohesin domain-containing protein [Geomonas sp. Red32]MCM0082031.1 cohesin domain-containing protein [Geomonas sp. Red32]